MKRRSFLILIVILFLLVAYPAWKIFGPGLTVPEGDYFYIPTGSTYENVKQSLIDNKIISSPWFFDQLSRKLSYTHAVKAGRYEIKEGSSLFSLVRMLRAGNQSPVNLVIHKIRTLEDLAAKIGANFECDSLKVIRFLKNPDSLYRYRLDSNTVMTAIIPNSYSILWNTTPSRIFKKLYTDQEKFWTPERKNKAGALNMTPLQIYIMASIVEEETNKEEDKGKIASVYFNRLETGMKLGADPTVKFAMRDFGLKRILFKHLGFESPFNTYQHNGLPPGPICTPSVKTIDAVLNAPQTNYIYFVAKPDFSGFSNFATDYNEHMVFAHAYQQALDSLIKAKGQK